MRIAIGSLVVLLFGACSGGGAVVGNSTTKRPSGGDSNADASQVTPVVLPDAAVIADAAAQTGTQVIVEMRIEPQDGVLVVNRGKAASVQFRAFARMQGASGEMEITDRTVFWVSNNYLVGGFPAAGNSTFTVRIPSRSEEPPQRAGVVTVNAKAASSGGAITAVTTPFTVKLADIGTLEAGAGASPLPVNPASFFNGAESAAYAPVLVYPNDGVLLPPNLGSLEVHWMPGASKGSLYEVGFKSELVDMRYYVRCQSDKAAFADNACVVQLDRATFDQLAQTHKGGAAVEIVVKASNEAGAIGTSKKVKLRFARDRVDGAVYYWNASLPPQIMRFDFGSQAGLESVVRSSDVSGNSSDARCVGCHILSHDGKHMAASFDALFSEIYIADLSLPKTATNRLTMKGTSAASRVAVGAFDPTDTQFVSTEGSRATELVFHDSATGAVTTTLDVGFPVAMPDWSPDGAMLAVTRIYGLGSSLKFTEGAIEIVKKSVSGFTLPVVEVVPRVSGKNRYNGTFTRDSATLLFSESIQGPGDGGADVDGYSDPGAKTWAVAAKAGATPILLANAGAPGPADLMAVSDGRPTALVNQLKTGKLMDTFPRPTPFMSTQDGHKLMWFTLASQRRAGLRRFFQNAGGATIAPTQTLLWMFALDADQLASGQDGSYPGFFLPFQDFKTSNHMAQWTQKYVSDTPPPPPPADPEPPETPPVTIIP